MYEMMIVVHGDVPLPRNLLFYNGKGFVIDFDLKVVRLDIGIMTFVTFVIRMQREPVNGSRT